MRRIALVALATSLAGCDMLGAAFTPAADRVNAAFPIPEELDIARARLVAALEADKPAQARATQEFGQLLNVRALTCSAASPPGRFETPAQLKVRLKDTACFARQDVALDEWVGLRRLAVALRAPALVPAAPLPTKAPLPGSAEPVAGAVLATEANVLALRGFQQKFTVVQVPTGKTLSTINAPDVSGRPASLSPNGRLLAVPGSKSLRVFDVDTGKLLWATEQSTEVVGWLPQVDVVVLSQAGTGTPQLLDTRLGRIETYPAPEKRLTWSAPLAGTDLLVGSATTATLMQHKRDANGGLDVTAARQWSLQGNAYATPPWLMAQGKKLVYQSNRDLGWLDLDSGQQGTWQLSAVSPSAFVKVDETQLAFDSTVAGVPGMATRILDIEAQTVQTARDLSERDGQLLPLGSRAGWLKRGNGVLALGGAMQGDNPQPLDRFISDAQLAQQLAKVNEASAAQEMPSERQALIEQLSRQVRAANTASAIRDGLPRETVEAIRRGELPRVTAAGAPAALRSPQPAPMLQDVPANAVVAVVGVYEPTSRPATPSRSPGNVRINVGAGSAPLVLVLSSYEPVNWVIQSSGRKIAAVLLSGYNESMVNGQGAAPVLRIGSRSVYKIESPEYLLLQRDIARYVAAPVRTFQGSYKGGEFSVQ